MSLGDEPLPISGPSTEGSEQRGRSEMKSVPEDKNDENAREGKS